MMLNPYPPAGHQWRPLGKDERRVTHSGLPIPPAYTDVFINKDSKSHLEAVGKDSKGRTIPIYKKAFREAQNKDKFKRIEKWEPTYGRMMAHVQKHFPKVEEAKVLYLVDRTRFRVGGEKDTKAAVQAYGATTLRSEHVSVDDKDLVKFTFVGKKGVKQTKVIRDPILAKLIRERKGKEKLFETSEPEVLRYMRSLPYAKGLKVSDFRLLHATKMAREEIAKRPVPKTKSEYKRIRNEIGDIVAADLGNTRSMALNSYIDPRVWRSWEASLPVVVKKAKRKKRSKR